MNWKTPRHIILVALPVWLATTVLAADTDPCPKLEVVPTGSQGNAVALVSTGTGGTEVQTSEAIPEEGGDWKAERPVAVTGRALTKFTVTPSDYEVIAALWHKLESPSAQATAQTDGIGELKLRLVAQEGAPSSATVIVDIYRTILPSSGVQGSLTLDGNAYSLVQAYVEHEQQSYTLNAGEELPLITLSGSASLSGMGALVVQTTATAAVQPCGATPVEETDDPDDDEDDPEDDCGDDSGGDGDGQGEDGGGGKKDCPDDDDGDDGEGDDGDEDGDDGDGDGDGECDGNGDAGDALHIHLTTGNIWTTIPIFRTYAAGGRELDFKLRYDSIRAPENGPLGWGWTHSYNIYVQQVGNKVIYHEGNGRRNAFTWNGSSYTKPIGRAFQLVVVGDHLELHRTNGTKEIFSPLDGGIGRISEIVDRRGRTTRLTYNGSQLTQIVSPHGRSVTIEWAGGHIWRATDPDSKVTTFEYWPSGELKKITDPLLHSVQYEYDGQHRVTKETLKNGKIYTAQFADGPDTHTIRDGLGQIVAQVIPDAGLTLPDNRTATISGGWLTHRDGRGLLWRVRRDNLGRLRQIISPNGYSWRKEYGGPTAGNNRNRVTRITNERGHYKTFTWNTDGNLTQRRDEAGHVTQFEYHPVFKTKLTKRIEPDLDEWVYQYDAVTGDLLTIIDPLDDSQHGYPQDQVVSFTYETHPAGVENLPGRIKKKTKVDRNGHVTILEYDTAGNLIQVTRGADDSAVSLITMYEHNAMGRTTRRVIERGDRQVVTEWTYDPFGRLLDTIQDPGSPPALNLVTSRAYDGHGNPTTITNPNGGVTQNTYDHRNRLILVAQATGTLNLLTQWFYDGNGNVVRGIDPAGGETIGVYNEQNFRIQSTDPEGYRSMYARDAVGNVLRIDRARERDGSRPVSVAFTYDALDRVATRTVDPDGLQLTTRYEYATSGGGCGCRGTPGNDKPFRITDPAGKVVFYHYDALDRRTKAVRKVGYDGSGGPLGGEVADVDDATTVYAYDSGSRLISVTQPEGEHVSLAYDAASRVMTFTISHADGDLTTTFEYNGTDNVAQLTSANGNVATFTYDGADRLTSVTDSLGALFKLTYDSNGNIVERSGAISEQTWMFQYDEADRLTGVYDPLGAFMSLAYDLNSNVREFVDGNGTRMTFVYDRLDRLVSTIDNAGGSDDTADTTTQYFYDGVNEYAVVDPNGHVTTYVFDDASRLVRIEFPDNVPPGAGVEELQYDAAGNIIFRRDPRGVETSYTYDDLHHPTGRTYGGTVPARGESFQFDRIGRLRAADNGWVALDLAYDDVGRLTTITQDYVGGLAYTTAFDYVVPAGLGGAERIVSYPSGRVVTEEYDARMRLAGFDSGPGVGATFGYDLADRRTAASLANGIVSVVSFDVADRIASIRHASQVANLFRVEYGYDAVGNRLFARNLTPGLEDRSELYNYDQRSRLRGMQRGAISAGPNPVLVSPIAADDLAAMQDWGVLDRRGNWNEFAETIGVTPVTTTQTRTPNGVNEYLSIDPDGPGGPQPPVNLDHDASGNLTLNPTARNLGDGQGGVPDPSGQVYEYDEENRLATVRRASDNALLLEIAYDALGRRVESVDYAAAGDACGGPPTVTRHVNAMLETLEEHVSCDGWANFDLAREIVWDEGYPEPVALVTHGGMSGGFGGVSVPPGESVYHYLRDAVGNVVALTNASGQVVERTTYDPYGNPLIEQVDPSTGLPIARLDGSAFGNPFAWTGHRWDAGVRLHHTLFRSFSPALGRWLQRDPLGYVDGINLYEYIGSLPLTYIDPLGLQGSTHGGGAAGGVWVAKAVKAAKDAIRGVRQAQRELLKAEREAAKNASKQSKEAVKQAEQKLAQAKSKAQEAVKEAEDRLNTVTNPTAKDVQSKTLRRELENAGRKDIQKKLERFRNLSKKDQKKELKDFEETVKKHREKYKNDPDNGELDRLERELEEMRRILEGCD